MRIPAATTAMSKYRKASVAHALALRSGAWARGGWTTTPVITAPSVRAGKIAPQPPNPGPAYRFNRQLNGAINIDLLPGLDGHDHYQDLSLHGHDHYQDLSLHGMGENRVAEARLQFLDWLQSRHPTVFNKAMGFDTGLADAGGPVFDAGTYPTYTTGPAGPVVGPSPVADSSNKSWAQSLTDMLPSLASSYAQVKLINTNLSRAEKGLPPLDSSSVAPTVKVAPDATTAGTIKLVGITVVGAAVLFGARALIGSRR